MSASPGPREQLRRQTGEAGRRHARVDAEIDRRRDRPPEPGDLFVLAATAEHPVEWAIIDRDTVDQQNTADRQRLLAVPADTNSLIGSADIAVSGEAGRGSLCLRCAHAVWLDAEAFDPGMRTGFLEPETLERVRRKHEDVERGAVTGSVLERDVDGEADYQEWVRVLERARESVSVRSSGKTLIEDNVVPLQPPPRWGPTSRLLAIAASVLLAMTLGLGGQLVKLAREHRAVVTEQRGELVRHEQERQQLAEKHRQDLAGLQEEQAQAQLEQQQRIDELEASAEPRAAINLPLIILASGQLRTGAEPIVVAPDASSLMLILQVADPRAYPRYRLDIKEAGSQRRVWRDSRLKPSRLSELTVLLPRRLLPDGRYELRLYGLRDGESTRLMEEILTLTSDPQQSTN